MNNKLRIALISCIVLAFWINYKISQNKIYHMAFSGSVKHLRQNDKNYPIVLINGTEFQLSFGQDEIKLNDSLVKKSKNTIVKQYRNGKLINTFYW